MLGAYLELSLTEADWKADREAPSQYNEMGLEFGLVGLWLYGLSELILEEAGGEPRMASRRQLEPVNT